MSSMSILSGLAGIRLRTKSLSPSQTLRQLLTSARDTRYGKAMGFKFLLEQENLYAAFAERIPLCDYTSWLTFLGKDYHFEDSQPSPLTNEAWPGIIKYFCLSSGTTNGKTKYIPYSNEMGRQNRRAAIDLLCRLIREQPDFNPFTHRTLYMSGSTSLKPDPQGVVAGDMSGLTKYLAPAFLSWMAMPPQRISSIEPWGKRLPELVKFALESRKNIGLISGIPVWQLTFLEEIQRMTGKLPSEVFPHLRFFIHGGMPLGPYEEPLRALLGEKIRFVDVYAASETGFSAVGLYPGKGLELWNHYGVFYEFEHESGAIYPTWAVKKDETYNLIVSSCSGLWRYRIGDRIRVLSENPVSIGSVFRAQTTTAFDEKISEEQVILATRKILPQVTDFSMGPDLKEKRHQWFIFSDNHFSNGKSEALDRTLRSLNQDYDDYRQDGRIQAPCLITVTDRKLFLETIGRQEGGQRKFPRLLDAREVDSLKKVFHDAVL